MKKKKDDDMEKLMRLTQLMKKENIKVAPKGPSKGPNKFRSQEPKFTTKSETPANVVEAGGMKVDPTLKEEYEQWRKDKEANRRESGLRAIRRTSEPPTTDPDETSARPTSGNE